MSALNEFSRYCENIVYTYAYKKDWLNNGVELDDLSDSQKEALTRLCSATHDKSSEHEIFEGVHFDEIVPMFRAYLKDAEHKETFLQLLTKNAFSACSGQIKEALEIHLIAYRVECGYVSANEELILDRKQRTNDMGARI